MSQKKLRLATFRVYHYERGSLSVWDLLARHLITVQSYQHHYADSLEVPSLYKAMLSFMPIPALFEIALLISKNKMNLKK